MDEVLKMRINELARKKRQEGLTSEEQEEQARLYRIYIDEIKDQLKCALDKAGIKPKE
ncbi:MAG: DUF896 domain-containing protein [Syntrophomonas sp.]|nr:DUF896 domain-containing protein [Syntrophomonas sp.]